MKSGERTKFHLTQRGRLPKIASKKKRNVPPTKELVRWQKKRGPMQVPEKWTLLRTRRKMSPRLLRNTFKRKRATKRRGKEAHHYRREKY